MAKFKIGDRVRRTVGNNTGMCEGDEGVVSRLSASNGFVDVALPDGSISPGNDVDKLELVQTPFPLYSEEEAVKLLIESGYKVEEPPKPRTGKAYVYVMRGCGTICLRKNLTSGGAYKLLAVVDWVEGDGLP